MPKKSWVEGAETSWVKIEAIYPKLYSALSEGRLVECRTLRRRLRYVITQALEKAHYKGRLLGALGDATLKLDARLKILLEAYAISVKERDHYNCLLTADSLASFFIERPRDTVEAAVWVSRVRRLLKKCPDQYIKNKLKEYDRSLKIVEKK